MCSVLLAFSIFASLLTEIWLPITNVFTKNILHTQLFYLVRSLPKHAWYESVSGHKASSNLVEPVGKKKLYWGCISYKVSQTGGSLSSSVTVHMSWNSEDVQNPVYKPPSVPRPLKKDHHYRVYPNTHNCSSTSSQQNHSRNVHVIKGLARLWHTVGKGQMQ